ncbi:MAG: hypothetical protein MI757_15950 [Pirellulales bacterium]|nr:hypothetical protein [Pirellulales bacterium]
MCNWLDTETKAALEKQPPSKLAPPDTVAFTLILIANHGDDNERLTRALRRILQTSDQDALRLAERELPVTVKSSLSYEDALLGQFELISCDAVSVFITDHVATGATREYLDTLYKSLLTESDEFQQTLVRVEEIPSTESGKKFIDQFIGDGALTFPLEVAATQKKARIMKHWGDKIGARLSIG